MKKNVKKAVQKKFSRQHFLMTLVLAVALTLGAWLALVLPSELAAANEESGHVHTFACYAGFELVCEDEGHAHTFECWQSSGELVCGLTEDAAHVHGSDGWICEPVAKVLTCDLPVHVHDESCMIAPVVVTPPEHSAAQPGNSTHVPGDGDEDGYIVTIVPGVEESDTPAQPQENGTPDESYGGVAPDNDLNFGVGDDNSNPEDSSNNEVPSGGDNSGAENPSAGDKPGAENPSADDKSGAEDPSAGDKPGAEDPSVGDKPGAENPSAGDKPGAEDPSGNDNQNSEVEPGDNAQTTGENQADKDNQNGAEPQADVDSQDEGEPQTGAENQNDDTSANNDEAQNTDNAQDDVTDQGEPAAQSDEAGSSTGEAEEGAPAPEGSTAFGLFHTVLADTYPPMDDYPQTFCNQTAHEHSEECYTEVYMCRKAPVAQIGENTFTDLQAAVDAAETGSEIVLLKDFAVEKTVNISGKTLSINLNGQTITYNGVKDSVLFYVSGNADLTLNGDGKLYSSVNGIEALVKVENAKFTLAGGTLSNINGIRAIDAFAGSKVNMTGGEISGAKQGDYGAGVLVLGNGWFDMTGGVIENNNAKTYGGAIRVITDGNVHIGGTARISNNTSQKYGGAICGSGYVKVDGEAVIIDNKLVNGNSHGASDICYSICTKDGLLLKVDENSDCYIEGIKESNADTVELQNLINNAENNLVTLEKNFGKVLGNIAIENDVTIDLNGHSIAYAGNKEPLFTVGSGKELTIKGEGTLSSTVQGLEALIFVDGGELNLQGGTLTNSNGYRAITAINNAVVNMSGGEISGVKNGSYGAGVLVKDGSQFNMTGGAITNNHSTNNGGAVYLSGSTSSATISDSAVIAGNIADGNGGGVYVANGTLNVFGGVIGSQLMAAANADIAANDFGKPQAGQPVDGNYANNGGGVYVAQGSLDINGGTISGNSAFCDEVKYNDFLASRDTSKFSKTLDELNGNGGGVFVGEGVTFNISGGNITGNTSYARPGIKVTEEYYGNIDDGGGGVYTRSSLNMAGGTISNNVAYAGGGGLFVDGWSALFNMAGGTFDGNVAIKNEGGGIYIGTANNNNIITQGNIINNTTRTAFDWGGGGIFVQTNAKLKITNAKITDNNAYGFGGGVAGCPSGDISVFSVNGASIYGNTAKGTNITNRPDDSGKLQDRDALNSPIFMHAGRYQDYFAAQNIEHAGAKSFVSGTMLGGADANWVGSVGLTLAVRINKGSCIEVNAMIGLTAEPETSLYNINNNINYKDLANENALVIITGNTSYTHGGGIMSNGELNLGTKSDGDRPNSTVDISVQKKYQSVDGKPLTPADMQFTFYLLNEQPKWDEEAKAWTFAPETRVSTESNDTAGNVQFTIDKEKIKDIFDKATDGKYTFYVVEQAGSNSGIIYDQSLYMFEVKVAKTGDDSYEITQITDSKMVWDKTEGKFVETASLTFTNKGKKEEPKPEYTQLTVKKVWAGDDNNDNQHPDSIKVQLLQDGQEMTGEEYLQVLSADNSWTHTWTNLLKSDGKGTTHTYSVKEVDTPAGYISTTTVNGNEVTITNTKQKPDELVIFGSKSLLGRDVQPGDVFTFAILSSKLNNGADIPMPEVTKIDVDLNTGDTFSFGPITFTKAGTYYYVIEETRPQSDETVAGVTYDPTLYRVMVEVKEVKGNLEAKATKLEHRETNSTEWETLKSDANGIDLTKADLIVFENTYSATEIDRYFRASKTLQNGTLAEGQFTFVLTAEGSRAWGSTENYVLDAAQPMPEDTQITDDGKRYREKTNGEGGFVTFNGIHFTKEAAGSNPAVGMEYHYIIREKQPTVDGTYAGQPLDGAVKNEQGQWVYNNIAYDNSVKNLYVHVYVEENSKFDENGTQVSEHQVVRAVVHDSDREATFTNTFTPERPQPQLGRLTVGKQVVGPAPAGAEYTFNVTLTYPDGTEETRTLTMQAGETRTIENLPEGTTYTVKEETPAGVNRIEYNYSDGVNAAGASNSGTISAPGEADEVTVTNYYPTPENPTPGNPGDDNPGGDEPNLPNPNDPGSPDEVTIVDEGVPLTYVKVYEPETEEYVYLPEDEVPLAEMQVPRTGDDSRTGWLALLSVLSLLGLAVLIYRKPKQEA